MIRVQVHLDEVQLDALRTIGKRRVLAVSALIREAIHSLLAEVQAEKLRTLDAIVGLWRGRRDVPDTDAYLRNLRGGRRRPGRRRS